MTANVNNSAPQSAQQVMQIIDKTPAAQIPDLDFVQKKFIENYNSSHREKVGELMYHRQIVHFKQAIFNNPNLAKCTPFSLYACFVTAAANGYSLDPADNEVYLIPRDGKCKIDRQAGAHVRRLIRTGQISHAEQAKLVYEGDIFLVENGRVIRHVENFQTDTIVAGYVKFVIDAATGRDLHFIYRRSDFESWRKKSPNPRTIEKDGSYGKYLSESLWDNGVLGGTQPEPNFLRTKIVKHAANEKCWASGMTPFTIESYAEVEVDTGDEDSTPPVQAQQMISNTIQQQPVAQPVKALQPVDDNSFTQAEVVEKPSKVFSSDSF